MIPMIRATGASVDGLNRFRKELAPVFRSSRRIICPVTVVPTLAPTIMPSDWCSVIISAPTRPEVMTIVAVDDWITAVNPNPRRNAFHTVPVSLSRTSFSAPEEDSFRLSPIRRMPYRNMASPPRRVIIFVRLIIFGYLLCTAQLFCPFPASRNTQKKKKKQAKK